MKAVITAAGLGTRLLSATKEQPKEMLPVFAAGKDRALCVKPLMQVIFEQLFDFGIREFYFVVGRGKRAIADHFTPDREHIRRLNDHGKNTQAFQLETFYRMIETSTIVWVNQPEAKGFGDAVLQAGRLIFEKHFLLHAGDTLIESRSKSILARLTEACERTPAEATLVLQQVEDPRHYGVAEVLRTPDGGFRVERVVEKPSQPTSKLAIMPLYMLSPTIYGALEATSPGKGGEIQLTDAIQRLIDLGHRVQAIKLCEDDLRVDIGTPETYWEALEVTHRYALSRAPD
jgi:UTP--glucose-1-phosphate uridylyltransferase